MSPEREERKKAMLLGSFLGDAFVLGAHWIYNVNVIEAKFGEYAAPQEPLPGSWHPGKHLGDYTHYGDQALLLNGYLRQKGGAYSNDGFREVWRQYMSSYAGYMDKATKESLEAFEKGEESGSHSDELGGAARLAPVLYWVDNPWNALEMAVCQSRLTHNSEASLLATELFSRMTLRCLEDPTAEIPDALTASLSAMKQAGQNPALLDGYLEQARAAVGMKAADMAAALGQSCHAEHAIPVIMAILLGESEYRPALQLNARIGGDSATRGMIIGAILGARNGMGDLPTDWLAAVKKLPELE
jgi:ADP-ribosylglycohydrolase